VDSSSSIFSGDRGLEVDNLGDSAFELGNVLGDMLVSSGKASFGIVRAGDEDILWSPVDETTFELALNRVSVQESQEEGKTCDVFSPEVIKDCNTLSIVSIEPSKSSRGYPYVVSWASVSPSQ